MRDPLDIRDDENATEPWLLTEVIGTGPNGFGLRFPGPVSVRAVYHENESYPVANDIWIHRPDTLDRILLVSEPDPTTGHHAVLYGREQHPLIQEGRLSAAWDVIEWLEKYQHRYQAKAVRRMFGIPPEATRA